MINITYLKTVRDYRFWHNIYILLQQFKINVLSQRVSIETSIEKLNQIGLKDAWLLKK